MRHLYKNLVLVVLSYSLALSSPASAQSSENYSAVKGYVNGSGKKSFKALFQKMDKGVPSNFYEEALKKAKGSEGSKWFDAAKLATNYSYFRIGNSKIFIRTSVEKGQTVFYANGLKITDKDFRDLKKVDNLLYLAYVAGYSAPKKSAFLNLFEIQDVNAGQAVPETGDSEGVVVQPQVKDECAEAAQAARSAHASNPQLAADIINAANAQSGCSIPPLVITNLGPAAPGKTGMSNQDKIVLAIFAIIFLLLMIKKNKKKSRSEVPEDQDCEGRGGVGCDDEDYDDDDGQVNCGGDGAQCGEGATPPPVAPPTAPGEPTAPPTYQPPTTDAESDTGTGRDEYDPNQYSIPMSKTKKK